MTGGQAPPSGQPYPYTATKFRIQGTSFHVSKLLPLEAFECLEIIREALGQRLPTLSALNDPREFIAILVMLIPRDELKDVRHRLFSGVTFKNTMAQTPQVLADEEATGFAGLDPAHVYEVLARCTYLNFHESFSVILSLADPEGRDSQQ